ncbi:hypothetical protein JCM10213_008300 [Rhodosporidiobolus nylandii]
MPTFKETVTPRTPVDKGPAVQESVETSTTMQHLGHPSEAVLINKATRVGFAHPNSKRQVCYEHPLRLQETEEVGKTDKALVKGKGHDKGEGIEWLLERVLVEIDPSRFL